MGKIMFCPHCFEDCDFIETKGIKTHEIRGEKIQNEITKYVCSECNNERILDEEYDKSLTDAFNKYRKQHNLLFQEDIKEIRKMYGLSQRAFARLLDWGQITIHRYENGALQDAVHDQVLKFLRKPENMMDFLEENKNNLKESNYKKLIEKTNRLILNNSLTEKIIIKQLQSIDNKYTGNKEFDIKKFINMIVYFAQNINKLWKTKLIKLLFYTDFLNYRKNSFSISGTPFVHWPHGPVPKHIYGLFEIITEDYKIIQLQEKAEFNYEGEIVINLGNFDETVFNNDERKSLEFVLSKFKDYTSSELSDLTHKEKAYLSTKEDELIPYEYANNLNIDY